VKVQKDTFFIRVQGDRNAEIGVVGATGEKIIVDTDYNKYKHTTQIGYIHALPIRITELYKNDTPLNVGDCVVFHHFVCQQDHRIEEGIYRAEYFHIYGKLIGRAEGDYSAMSDGWGIQAIEDAIFVEPVLESEDNLYAGKIRIKTFQENIKQQGIVFAASKQAKLQGIQDGDRVFFTASADYKMKIIDKDLYRMRIRNIIAVERGGRLVCLHDKILVKEFGNAADNKFFVNARKSPQKIGEIIQVGKNVQGVTAGANLSYFDGVQGVIKWGGDTYSVIELRNINYLITTE
jgi:co-chaperonin GroES (HSP10)